MNKIYILFLVFVLIACFSSCTKQHVCTFNNDNICEACGATLDMQEMTIPEPTIGNNSYDRFESQEPTPAIETDEESWDLIDSWEHNPDEWGDWE